MTDETPVRPAVAKDVPAICSFGEEVVEDHCRPLIGEEEAAAQVREWWNQDRITEAVESGLVVVAKQGGHGVGVAPVGAIQGRARRLQALRAP